MKMLGKIIERLKQEQSDFIAPQGWCEAEVRMTVVGTGVAVYFDRRPNVAISVMLGVAASCMGVFPQPRDYLERVTRSTPCFIQDDDGVWQEITEAILEESLGVIVSRPTMEEGKPDREPRAARLARLEAELALVRIEQACADADILPSLEASFTTIQDWISRA